jgi:glutamate 5-kinase
MTAKKHWMLHALSSCGRVVVDAGAARALQQNGASLLPSGVVSMEGDFRKWDAVQLVVKEGRAIRGIAKGITQYGSLELKKIKGKKSTEIKSILGYSRAEEVVRRGEMVLTDET